MHILKLIIGLFTITGIKSLILSKINTKNTKKEEK